MKVLTEPQRRMLGALRDTGGARPGELGVRMWGATKPYRKAQDWVLPAESLLNRLRRIGLADLGWDRTREWLVWKLTEKGRAALERAGG